MGNLLDKKIFFLSCSAICLTIALLTMAVPVRHVKKEDDLASLKAVLHGIEDKKITFKENEEKLINGILLTPYKKNNGFYVRLTFLPLSYSHCVDMLFHGLSLSTRMTYNPYVNCQKEDVSVLSVDLSLEK